MRLASGVAVRVFDFAPTAMQCVCYALLILKCTCGGRNRTKRVISMTMHPTQLTDFNQM